ncbi:MAG: FixH family protein [Rhodospirillales bacterium]|nr:FixH family protein [Rhodospirillales bacterium]
MSDTADRGRPVDKWIPWFFVLFFVVLAILDGIFVTIALKTHTGTVTDNPYEEGLAYNKTLEAAAARDALGWQADLSLGADHELRLSLADDQAKPIEGASVVAKIIRPVQDGYDFEIALTEQGSGVYKAPANLPLPGQWQVRIFATWQDKHYQHSRTIIAP